MEKSFSQWKRQCLNKLDQSKKGSVDEDITDLVSLLNACEQFFTTSSCSGRIILIDGAPECSDVQKQNCVWLFVSHKKCKSDELIEALSRSSGDAVLKFEPFVLHVQCRKLEDAQLMHSVAINSGFRNSGLTVSKTGKIITAVRSTHSLEVPLSHQGKIVVEHEYIKYLSEIANQKMEENLRRINRFYQNLQSALAAEKLQKLQIPGSPVSQHRTNKDSCNSQETQNREKKQEETEKRNNCDVYRRRRKREQLKTDCCHGDEDSSLPELDDCLDLFA